MKTSLALLLIVVIGIAAFLMGRGSPGPDTPDKKKAPEANTRTISSQALANAAANAGIKVKPRTNPDAMTTAKAAQMTPADRIELLKKASVLADPEKQADILVGLISAMTQDELVEATRLLLDAQRKGNVWSTETWNTLWTQWGKVNAEACLALSKTGERYPGWNGLNGLNTTDDYRCLMVGWLEVRPEDAMAWARQAKDNIREAVGGAFAITSSADGDLKQMEAAILANANDDLTRRACFQDYFDLAVSRGEKPSDVYSQIDPKLREAAWPETLARISQSDLDEAASWLKAHGNDPGRNNGAVAAVIMRLSSRDPAAAAEWAAGLPSYEGKGNEGTLHPGETAFFAWVQRDNAAANEWLKTQPANTPWIVQMMERMENSGEAHEAPEVPE